jgi:nitrous oxide reductase accessory protein NosL
MRKIIIGFFLVSLCIYANKDTNDTTWQTKPIAKSYTLNYDKNTTGLVRNLLIYKNPKWISKIEIRNGKIVYFCSPKSMFEFYFYPGRWYEMGVRSENDFNQIVVTDFNTLKPIDAKKAFFVYGSKAISPAGDDLPAFETKDEAKKFVESYGGSRIFTFKNVSNGLIKLLNNSI